MLNMAYTQTQGEVTRIKVKRVGPVGLNKKGKEFFMVNDSHDTGWYCENIALRSSFLVGSTVTAVTETKPSPRGFFHSILDVVKDGQVEDEGNDPTIEVDREGQKWDGINAKKNESISQMNAKNNASMLVAAAIQSGTLKFGDHNKPWEEEVKRIYEYKITP